MYESKTSNNTGQRSYEFLERILAVTPGHVYWKNLKGEYLGCNNLQAIDAGLKHKEDIIGLTDYDMPWKDEADFLRSVDAQVIATGEPIIIEEKSKLFDGREVIWLSRKEPLRSADGGIIGIIGTSIDITDRKETERIRMEKSEQLESVLAVAPGHVYWKNLKGEFLGCNNLQAIDAGLKHKEDIIGLTDYDMPWKEDADFIRSVDAKVIATGEPVIAEEKSKTFDGREAIWLSTKEPLRNEKGEIIGIIGTSIDITAHKERDKLLLENERYKVLTEQQEIFRKKADQMVHDIRSPVTSIQMFIGICEDLKPEDREMLLSASGRVQDIVGSLLREYTPKKDGSQDFAQLTLVSTLMTDILSEKRSEYRKSPIKFMQHSDFDSSFAFININRSNFSRAISNLINNAVDAFDHNKDDCVISLNIDSTPDSVTVIIEDNGQGMPPEIVTKLLNNIAVTSGKENGHGIGFTQVYDALKEGGGKVNISSKPGVGTSVILTFPRVAAPQWIAEKIELNRDDIIIIVDDDLSIHGAWDNKLKVILKQAPYIQVEHFTMAQKALNFIDNLSEQGKQKVLLLTDSEFEKEELTGLQIIERSGVRRSLLVTSFYGKEQLRNAVIASGTKILPKTLAPMILITFAGSISEIKPKYVDLVLVDDDKDFIQSFIRSNGQNKKIDLYEDPGKFLSQVMQYSKDTLIYVDNIFPNADVDGIDIAKNLHSQGYKNICVISGKPLPRKVPSYIKLISKADIEQLADTLPIPENKTRKVDLVFIDDDKDFVDNFARFMAKENKIADKYYSAREFLGKISQYPKDTKLFLDNEFTAENITGFELARQLHELGFSHLYLLSGRDFSGNKSLPKYLTPILKTDFEIVKKLTK